MKKILAALTLVSALNHMSFAQSNLPPDVKMDTIVNHAAESFINGKPWLAFSAGAVKDGVTRSYNYGTIQKGKNIPPTGENIYEIGSITKTFGSLILAHAVLEGRVKLDDDIRKYLRDGYPNLQYGKEPIRLIHLVNLTSRLPDNLPDMPEAFKNVS